MSQAVEVNMEPLKWPIAPDCYIPNSVIRSWRRKGVGFTKLDRCNDAFFYGLHQADEGTTNVQEDLSSRVFLFLQDEEEEKEETDDVEKRMNEKQNEKKKKNNVDKTEVERKERVDEKKEKVGDKTDETSLVKQSYSIHNKTTLQTHQETHDDRNNNVEPQGVSLSYDSKKTVIVTPTSSQGNEKELLRKQRELREVRADMKPPETISHPPQYVSASVPKKQTTSGISPKEWAGPPTGSPVVSADYLIPKQEPRITSRASPVESKILTPHPLKSPPPTPEDPQPQQNPGSPDYPAIRDSRNDNVGDQEHVYFDRKVLELYKKFKVSNKDTHLGKLSTTAEHGPVSKATHTNIQTKTGVANLKGGLGSPSEFQATLSNVHHPIINTECPIHQICSAYPAQFTQNILETKRIKYMPEWRKNFYKLISVHGFCSPRAARLATKEHPVKSSDARKLSATIPSLQAGQAASHQRVVQKIQMKDTLEPISCQFRHVIPMASQHSVFTLNPCGTTLYGRLQFDWVRGFEEDGLLSVSAVKIKDSAYKVVNENRAFNHLNRSG